MLELTTFRDDCRRWAVAAHRDGCEYSWWRMISNSAQLITLTEKPASECAGCISPQDRALFAHLADEIDAYLSGGDDEPLADWTELSGGVE